MTWMPNKIGTNVLKVGICTRLVCTQQAVAFPYFPPRTEEAAAATNLIKLVCCSRTTMSTCHNDAIQTMSNPRGVHISFILRLITRPCPFQVQNLFLTTSHKFENSNWTSMRYLCKMEKLLESLYAHKLLQAELRTPFLLGIGP